jgi:lauroyl/myristoyl acyltransferase
VGFLYHIAFRLARVVPLGIASAIGWLFAVAHFTLHRSERRGVFANLAVIRPDAQRRERSGLAFETFIQAGRNMVDFFRLPSLTGSQVRRMIDNAADVRTLLDARVRGVPACIMAAHYGSWELAGAVLGDAGYQVHAIALPHRDRLVEKLYADTRNRFGVVAHDMRLGLRDLLRHLPAEGIPAIVSDRSFGNVGESVLFFGRRVYFPRGAAVLAYRKHLVGIPGFLVRQSDGRFHLVFGEAISPAAADERSFVSEFVQEFARQYEAVVGADPTQFLNFYNYWQGAE